MSHTSVRITKPVNVEDDLGTILGTASGDTGVNCTASSINKWAKWKPLKSMSTDITTEEARRAAGRTGAGDFELQFGVRATGVGNINVFRDLHNCRFTYEKPSEGYSMFRVTDFHHPTVGQLYGYRHDAYFDFMGNAGGTSIPFNSNDALSIYLTYNPHSSTLREEMLSIKDFLSNDGLVNHDPLDCYPCVLISQGTSHWVHCLYPSGSTSTPTTIGSTGQTAWRLSTMNYPSGMSAGNATFTVFLSSAQLLIAGDYNYDIANWIDMSSKIDDSQQAWAAWFCAVPELSGLTVSLGASALPTQAMVASVSGLGTIQFILEYTFTEDYTGSIGLSISVNVGTSEGSYPSSATHTKTLSSASDFMTYTETFTYNELSMIVTSGQTIYVMASIVTTINGSTATSIREFSFTI